MAISLTPSAIVARGELTGLTISSTPGVSIAMNTQTVQASALAVSVSPAPSAQSAVAGTSGFVFARYQFDAGSSGEDARITSLRLRDTYSGSPGATDLHTCQLLDGTLALNTGSNVVNPSLDGSSPDDFTFTLDTHLIIPRGTFKTVELRCSVSGSAESEAWVIWRLINRLPRSCRRTDFA